MFNQHFWKNTKLWSSSLIGQKSSDWRERPKVDQYRSLSFEKTFRFGHLGPYCFWSYWSRSFTVKDRPVWVFWTAHLDLWTNRFRWSSSFSVFASPSLSFHFRRRSIFGRFDASTFLFWYYPKWPSTLTCTILVNFEFCKIAIFEKTEKYFEWKRVRKPHSVA